MRPAVFLGILLAAAVAHGATVVYPTGSYPADVQNVQAALGVGGTVLLKATDIAGAATAFNFGPPTVGPGFVTFSSDTELVGERLPNAETTIRGGYYPVRGSGALTAAVRYVTFDRPLRGAIRFVGPGDASTEITNNRIVHVAPLPVPGGGTAEAIVVVGGRVAINDNVIDHVDANFGTGISEFNSAGPVEILRNHVYASPSSSIECTRNRGTVRIEDNVVRPGPTPNGFGGTGIEVNGTGSYVVAHNDVLIEAPGAIGIFVFGTRGFNFGAVSNPVIAWNRVVMNPAGTIGGYLYNDGIDLAGLVSGAFVGQNSIEGPGFSAFSLFAAAFDPADPSDIGFNTYAGNNIAHVQAQVSDVFLDTVAHDTVFKGQSGFVLDFGVNNALTGFTRVPGPTGQQVSEAIRLRNVMTKVGAVVGQ